MNKGYIFLGLTSLMFGTFEVTSKLIHGLEATQLNFLRFFVGGIALLPFGLLEIKRKRIRFKPRDILYIVFLGIIFVPVSMGIYQIAVAKNPASVAVFIFSANPIFIAFFAFVILKEIPNKFIILAIILGVFGLSLITNPFGESFNIFVLYAIFAAVIFAFYNVLMRRVTHAFGNLVTTSLVVASGTVVLFFLRVFQGAPLFQGITWENILPLLYLGIFCSGLTYVSYYKGMQMTSTNVGSIVFFLKPILSTFFAVIILNEHLTVRFLMGAAFIFAGSLLMVYGREKVRVATLKK